MMSLEQFKKSIISPTMLKNITGGETDTAGGDFFFGYGKSECDIKRDDGKYDYYFGEVMGWLIGAGGNK